MEEATYEQVRVLPVVWAGTVMPDDIDHNGHMNIERYFAAHCRGLATMFDVHFRVDEAYRRERGQGLFTIEQHLRYVGEAFVGDRLTVRLQVLDRSDKVVHLMSYLLDTTRGHVANTVELTAVHVDLSTRRATPFTADLAACIDGQISVGTQSAWRPTTCGVMGPRRRGGGSRANHRSTASGAEPSTMW